ncbi:MAG: hypothetical protein LCH54_13040 [Bacteroidetes bacterium]|nr:hypothetical protein [Bacteroidota bacterium]MCA0447144.1 hypothetical protein [Bacteroidota bacterium]
MAIVKDNIITTGLSGKLGKQLIFKQSGRETVLALAPKTWPSRTSPDQIQKQNRFREAVAFAKSVLSDPVSLKKYEDLAGENRTAYHAALSDFLSRSGTDPG